MLEWYAEDACRTKLLIVDEADRLKTISAAPQRLSRFEPGRNSTTTWWWKKAGRTGQDRWIAGRICWTEPLTHQLGRQWVALAT